MSSRYKLDVQSFSNERGAPCTTCPSYTTPEFQREQDYCGMTKERKNTQ